MRSISALPASLLALVSLALADDLKVETTSKVSCSRPTRPGDTIAVHYRGTLQSDGSEFDASYDRSPIKFALGGGQVIKGWDEGLKDMCPGEQRILTIPSDMAYGDFGSPPAIPGGATLVFQTKLMEIVGVDAGVISTAESSKSEFEPMTGAKTIPAKTTDGGFTIATAPPEPTAMEGGKEEEEEITPTPALEATPLQPSATGSPKESKEGECHLLGPFALLVQAALGIMALLSLVYKRWRETPKRPWKIWFFDVSKQVVGSVLVHILNLVMSMLGAADIEHASQTAAGKNSGESLAADSTTQGGRSAPNPCSYYLLNLLIDVSHSALTSTRRSDEI